MLDTWHRLERVIKWTGLSVNSFALNIGLKRSENLYQIKKGNNGISRDLATLITTKYPSAASRSAVARPMPDVAPVISACFFIKWVYDGQSYYKKVKCGKI